MAVSTYYFDGHNGITDPDSAWTNEAYVFDGDPDTSTYGISGSSSSNYLLGKGTTAPSSGGIITQVRAKIIGTNTTWVTLDEPTGGWTWGAVSELEVRVWNEEITKWTTYANASVYAQNGELPPLFLGTTVRTSILVSGIEIEVTHADSPQAYDAIIATITVASDASQVVKAMVKSTTWREGTSGSWLTTDCTLNASTTYQFRTPLSGMSSGYTAVLPNIKASVTVAWDTTATPIGTVGDYFMYCYADSCSNLTSLSVPDTSGLTSVGDNFMRYYAYGCSSLTSLSVPDTSGLTSVGDYFMYAYAYGCSSLTSLSAPDTSGLASVGDNFMGYYAYGCSNLTSLSVPDTSGLTSVGDNFMRYYAYGCSNLTSLSVPDTSGLTSVGNYFMYYYAYGCSSLTSLSVPDTSGFASVGNYFMYYYAYGCSGLTSLSVPDTSGLTSVGDYFMYSYAEGCSSLTSLSIPDTSGLTSVGDGFMYAYAYGCSSLTSLSIPDTSGLTSVGDGFMYAYAYGCSSLTSLSVPDTSGFASVGISFMGAYAGNCTSLTSLILPDSTGWFGSHNVDWSVPSGRLGYLYGYTPNSTSQTAWRGLTDSGETLYTNYIRAEDHVLLSTTPVIGAKYPLPPFRRS